MKATQGTWTLPMLRVTLSQVGIAISSLALKMRIFQTGCYTFLLRLVAEKLMVYQEQFSLLIIE